MNGMHGSPTASQSRGDAAKKDRLWSFFQQAPGMIAMVEGPEHIYEFANSAYLDLIGRRDVIGRRVRDVAPELEHQGTVALLDKVYSTGEPFVGRRMPIAFQRRADAPPETRYIDFVYQPVTDEQGRVTGIFAQGFDVTDHIQVQTAVRESEARLRLALDAGRMAVWESDTRTNSITTSPELNHLLGFAEDASPTIEEIRSRYAPGAQDRLRAVAAAALSRGEHHAEEELEVIWPDGSHHWLLLRAELEVAPRPDSGVFIKAMGVAFDITGRKLWEERQRLLINELNHRVKNTLATVQSIAAQTFRDVHEESRPKLKAFEERLFALARAHDVLTRENWEGAELREIIAEVLEPYRRLAGERFEVRGPHLRLSPSMALALAMALHELATNASKYGALSVPRGRVSIRWTLTSGDSPKLALQWREHHGPSVLPPTRRGFGTRLIERSLASDLGGHVRLIYDPSGVICRVEAPLNDYGSGKAKP